MARRKIEGTVSGNGGIQAALGAAASVHRSSPRGSIRKPVNPDRMTIAKAWQIEAYRHTNICGEARYAATLFANIAGRAEIGVSEPQALARKAVWVTSGAEVEAFNELAPTVRDRSKLIRDYMLHRVIAGECYLIARDRLEADPDGEGPLWEVVAVTEIRKTGSGEEEVWSVRVSNQDWMELSSDYPIIRLWSPDPEDRTEAWSPFRSLLPTLREIEWLTKHIFTQVRSRLMSAGVWFLPDNLTFPPPPPEAIEGDYAEAMAVMNDAEKFMVSLAASGMDMLDDDEVSFPSVVMADSIALSQVDQQKLIQFWSEIDDKAMTLRSDAVRRFSLGMDLPPEQVLGSSGLAVTGAGGSAGSVNHWGVWANEEQTISAHVEPALDDLVAVLTTAFLHAAVDDAVNVIGYDTATLRLRQDRSKEALELYDRGLLNREVTLREVGFDPANDLMGDEEFKRWLLIKLAGGSATPEQVHAAFALLGVTLPVPEVVESEPATRQPTQNLPPSLEDHPHEGPPREQHDHSPAPFGLFRDADMAAAEVLVLRALEKAGNRLLNDGKRGREKDRNTPAHLAHTVIEADKTPEFDFSLTATVFGDRTAVTQALMSRRMSNYCASLYKNGEAYSRDGLIRALEVS